VIRIYGYDRVPVKLPNVAVVEMVSNPRIDLEEKIRHILIGTGYSEVVNYSFVTPEFVDYLCLPENDERRRLVRIKNPLAEDQSVMRTTMVFGLLDAMKKNNNNGSLDLKIFEMGRVFIDRKREELPEEKNMLACLLTGVMTDNLWGNKVNADFYDLKGCIENIFYDFKLTNCHYRSSISEPFLHPGKSCGIYIGELLVGYMGQVHLDVLDKMDLKNCAYVFEINLDILENQVNNVINYKEISKFPVVTRDVAFLIPAEMETNYMIDIVLRQSEELLENVVIFDIYAGKGISQGMKSLGLRFSYRAPDRTLTDVEVNSIHDKIVQNTVGLTGAKIRGE
jgi:phenylalanyl-tRNA synthetase beta chain